VEKNLYKRPCTIGIIARAGFTVQGAGTLALSDFHAKKIGRFASVFEENQSFSGRKSVFSKIYEKKVLTLMLDPLALF